MALLIIAACTTPSPQPYTLTIPVAETGPQHLLLGQAIDINIADAPALEALPGIGPALAARIVADRQARGPFHSVASLARVPGVGEKLLHRVKEMTTVGPNFAK